MKMLFFLADLRYTNPFALTVLGMAGVVLFTVLDQGLSGGSAQDPAYSMALLTAGSVALELLAFGPDSGPIRIFARLLGASPILLVIGVVGLNMYKFENSPSKVAQRALADNFRCIAKAVGATGEDRSFVRAKANIVARWGDMHGSSQKAIEDRFDITILPDCQFTRGAPDREPEPGTGEPEIILQDYQPAASSEALPPAAVVSMQTTRSVANRAT